MDIEGKRKIEIKKLEKLKKSDMMFTKRKLGLFNKVTELSILCEAKSALIIKSQNNVFYACGYPDCDTVIQDFMAGRISTDKEKNMEENEIVKTLRLQYEEIQNQLNQEKNNLKAQSEAQKTSHGFPFWWNNSIDDMDLESLDEFKSSLEKLKLNLVAAMEENNLIFKSNCQTIQDSILNE